MRRDYTLSEKYIDGKIIMRKHYTNYDKLISGNAYTYQPVFAFKPNVIC